MAGIDHDRVRKILVEDDQRDEKVNEKIKLENTFLDIREDAADRELQGLNDI